MELRKQEQIQVILEKGVSEVLPSKEFVQKALESGKTLTVYAGFDPTGPTLHLGHGIQLRKLSQFQELGHKIIFLVGDFTARIGDPTDKGTARKPLTKKEVEKNLKLYKKQASRFIRFSGKNKAVVKYNNDWLGKMKFADVLSLASEMTVDQMLKRDMFARRIEENKPIYIHEFMYPLMQGYDSVHMNVDGEIGGNDQLFNMLAGRTLQKSLQNKEKFVITTKLLADPNGKKMGKSEGNMVSFLDTPEDMYGKVMSWTDGMVLPAFELCTDYTFAQLAEVEQKMKTTPRDTKMLLAFELVKSYFGETLAQKAQDAFVATFQKKEVNDSMSEIIGASRTLEEILLEEKLVSSKSEIRRLSEAGGITNFGTKEKITLEQVKEKAQNGVYKIGKKTVIKIV